MSRKVQSLERGLMVLEALVRSGPSGVTQLAAELDLDKTIVHRLLVTLQALGYVSQDANRRYLTGTRLRTISAKVLASLNLRALALPYMDQLAEHTQGVAHLAKMAETRAVYIERVQHPSLMINTTDVGGEAPGYCSAAGKVLWAFLTPLELNKVLDQTDFRAHTMNTITDRDVLQHHLAQVREVGIAIDNQEHRLGLVGIGAPVRDHMGNVIASICVGRLASQLDEPGLREMRDLVHKVAQQLSFDMGYTNDQGW